MDRRRFLLTSLAGAVAGPLAAEAQPAVKGKVYRIGFIGNETPTPARQGSFWDRMRELGWVQGQNVVIELRAFGTDVERVPEIAKELIGLGTDVFLVGNAAIASRIRRETRTIPIVILSAGDLVAAGLAESVARPGGNVTGLQVMQTELGGKHLSLLKEALPDLKRVGILAADFGLSEAKIANPQHPTAVWIHELRTRAPALGLQLQVVIVGEASGGELERAFASFKSHRAQAIVVYGTTLTYTYQKTIADLALTHRLPTISQDLDDLPSGYLMCYGWDREANVRLAAEFVDKILRGAKAGDIPIQQPTTFRLGINLKTAKAIGLTIPPSLLARADQVIE
jgi:putative tryptophan/tyrosine transport system substrate-binding protein